MGCSHSMIGGCSFIEPEDANNGRKDGRRPRGGKTAASAIAGAPPSPSLGVVDVRATGRKMAWSPGWMLSRASAIRRRGRRRKRGETYEERCGLENKSWLLTYAQAEAPPADPHSLHTSFPFRSGSQAEGASELPGAASVVAATTVLLFANLEDEGEEAGRGEGEGVGVGNRQSLELLERSISPFAGALVRFSYAEILSATWGFSKGIDLFLIIC